MQIQASDLLLSIISDDASSTGQVSNVDSGELQMIPIAVIRKLNEQSTSKLAEITRTIDGSCNVAEINAARELLDRSTQRKQR